MKTCLGGIVLAITLSGCAASPIVGAVNVAKWDGFISNRTK